MPYLARLADQRLKDLLQDFPTVLINGPRAVGKTTTARQLAREVVQLDAPAQAAAFLADPDDALRNRREPLLLDEWQSVPAVLGAVRRAVDSDPRPGRFILTGSVRAELESEVWPGTGRLIRLQMHGLTEAEILSLPSQRRPAFLDRLAQADLKEFDHSGGRPGLRAYVTMALRGGFPEPVLSLHSEAARNTWLDSYLDQLLTRDAAEILPRGDPQRMRQYFRALALSTAGSPLDKTLSDAAGINFRTARSYDALFERLFVADRIPGWQSNRLSRLVNLPKRYVLDTGLVASACQVTVDAVLRDGDLLGRVVDTFAASQLWPELALSSGRLRPYHIRTKGGREEIDLLIEVGGDRVLALEFKASAAPTAADAKHLIWLRDRLGDRFLVGAVMHTGPTPYRLARDILAIPIAAVWQ